MTDSLRILLTDDESGLRTAMGRVLGGSGLVVDVATTGIDAWRMVEAAESAGNRFDLLITDVNMPGMRGDELVSKLRAEGRELEILVISGFGDKSLLVDLMRMGVNDYMDKPFSAGEFQDKVAQICERIRTKRLAAMRTRNLEGRLASLSSDLVRYRRGFDEMKSQMELAVRSYQSLVNLPQEVRGLDFEFRVRALHDLGGDFLGINPLKNGAEILLADVAGHDMGASYVTILVKSFFENNKDVMADGERFFQVLNSGLIEQGADRMVSALHVLIDYGSARMVVTTAAHPSPILRKLGFPSSSIVECWGDPLGISPAVAFSKWEAPIIPGDRLFLFTDGLPSLGKYDPAEGRRRELSESGIDRLVASHRQRPLREAVDRIWNDSLEYANFNSNDDLLLLGVEIAEECHVQG